MTTALIIFLGTLIWLSQEYPKETKAFFKSTNEKIKGADTSKVKMLGWTVALAVLVGLGVWVYNLDLTFSGMIDIAPQFAIVVGTVILGTYFWKEGLALTIRKVAWGLVLVFVATSLLLLSSDWKAHRGWFKPSETPPPVAAAKSSTSCRVGTQCSVTLPPRGYSNHILPPVGFATTFSGHGYTIHCVYRDGKECVIGDKKNPCVDGDILYQYLRNTTENENTVSYKFVRG